MPQLVTLHVTTFDEFGKQYNYFLASFTTEDQALAFIARKPEHSFSELQDEPTRAVPDSWARLIERLYPTCEHGLSQSNCCGPQHYWFDEEEQARGMQNGW